MKTLTLLAASLVLVALAPLVAAEDATPSCTWPRKYVDDITISWEGNTVQVLFIDNSPTCQVQVKCGGYMWNCWSIPLPPSPPAWILP